MYKLILVYKYMLDTLTYVNNSLLVLLLMHVRIVHFNLFIKIEWE